MWRMKLCCDERHNRSQSGLPEQLGNITVMGI